MISLLPIIDLSLQKFQYLKRERLRKYACKNNLLTVIQE